jgi:hypothetical protein
MSVAHLEQPNLPEFMTWAEYEALPEDVAAFVELCDGRPVWVADEVVARRGPAEHQRFTLRVRNALERSARAHTTENVSECWQVDYETNVFLEPDRSSFLTPDIVVYRCLEEQFADIFATDTALVGEVLSPSDTPQRVETKKKRYARAGIPWYWEIDIDRTRRAVSMIRAYALEVGHGRLADGVTPLRPVIYRQVAEWEPATAEGPKIDFPFPIQIPWQELEF